MSGGGGLYEALCDFECSSVQHLIEQHGAMSDVVRGAADVAHAVWERRLSAALPGGDEVLKAYKDWNDALPDSNLRKAVTDKLLKVRLLLRLRLRSCLSWCLCLCLAQCASCAAPMLLNTCMCHMRLFTSVAAHMHEKFSRLSIASAYKLYV